MLDSKLIRNVILIGFPLLIVLVILWAVFVKLPLPCAFYVTTGLYCPTCGATRAVISLLSGDVLNALKCNLIVALLFLPATIGAAILYLRILNGHSISIGKRSLRIAIIILTIFIVFGIIRNIPIEPFTFLVP